MSISNGITYNQNSLFVRIWDWFNDGRAVTPLSFCQFWRTVLLYSPIKFVLKQVSKPFSVFKAVKSPVSINTPPTIKAVTKGTASGLWSAVKAFAKAVWYPSKIIAKTIWKPLRPVVMKSIGGMEFIAHSKAGRVIPYVLVGLIIAGFATDIIFLFVVVSISLMDYWQWCLVGFGIFIGAASYVYVMLKSGIVGFLANIILSAKHGICPPVTINR